jgi:hypothetical protein
MDQLLIAAFACADLVKNKDALEMLILNKKIIA